MLSLFNSLVRSKLEFCCELWSPYLKKDIVLLEQVLRSFTNRISGQKGYDYWQRLRNLKISSLQRRRERLCILHVWKIKNYLVPNSALLEFKLNRRSGGFQAVIKPLPKVRGKLLTIFDESFLVKSCKLWNVIPPDLTHISNINTFKSKLDMFLIDIPDEPPLPGYATVNTNSITEQCLRSKSNC